MQSFVVVDCFNHFFFKAAGFSHGAFGVGFVCVLRNSSGCLMALGCVRPQRLCFSVTCAKTVSLWEPWLHCGQRSLANIHGLGSGTLSM
mmetsp:Transcript_27441/g.63432  ORF Transcript_27441/g.63432 Transcript_27441/m.63432 type:complete len:89 (+) Transcript_27441:807-1073(+)